MQNGETNYYKCLYELEAYREKVFKSTSPEDLILLAMEIKGYIFDSEYLKQIFLKRVNSYGAGIKLDKNKDFEQDLIKAYITPILKYNKDKEADNHNKHLLSSHTFDMLCHPILAGYLTIDNSTAPEYVGIIDFYYHNVLNMFKIDDTDEINDGDPQFKEFKDKIDLFYDKYRDLISNIDFYLFVTCGYNYTFECGKNAPLFLLGLNRKQYVNYNLLYIKSVLIGVIHKLCCEIERNTREYYDDSINTELKNQELKDTELYDLAVFIKKHPSSKYTIDNIVDDYDGILPNSDHEFTRDKLTKLIGQIVDILETEAGKERGISRLRELLKKHDLQ